MRSAYLKDVVRSARGSLGRFLAIMGIAALGCGFFAGLQMSGTDMRAAADALYDGCALYDIRLVSTLGFSKDDLARIEQVDGVDAVMPSVTCDVIARFDQQRMAVRISSLDVAAAKVSRQTSEYVVASGDASYLNRLILREGRWPEALGECVICADKDYPVGFGVGDTVEVLYGTQNVDDLLVRRQFSVVGRVSSPNYPYTGSFGSTSLGSGMIDQYLYVAPESFVEDLPFTEVYVTVDGARAHESGSDSYKAAVDEVKGRFGELAQELGALRLADVKAEAQRKLDDKRADYLAERADAERKLDDAAAELSAAAKKLEDGESELVSGRRDYDDGTSELERSKRDAADELADAQAQIDSGWAELASTQDTLADGERALADGERQLEDAKKELEQGERELEEGERALNMTQADIDAARAEIELQRLLWEALRAELEQAIGDLDGASGSLSAVQTFSQRDDVPTQDELNALSGQIDSGLTAAGDLATIDIDGVDLPAFSAQLAGLLQQAKTAAEGIDLTLDQAQIIQQVHNLAPTGTSGAIAGAEQIGTTLNATIYDGDAQIADATAQLDLAQATRDALDVARKELAEGRSAYEAGRNELEAKRSQLASGRSQLEQGRDKLFASERELAAGRAEADAKIADGESQLADALDKLVQGEAELDEGRKSCLDGLGSYLASRDEAKTKFADAEAQLDDAQREIDELSEPDIHALDRTKNEGAVAYQDDSRRMDSIANVFPAMFFLVAALVSLTTMTRMVDDERVMIGTYKALGYSKSKIAGRYLAYAGAAGTLGAALGIIVLAQVLPYIVICSYGIIYAVPVHPFPLPVDLRVALLAGGLGVGVTLFATYAAALSSLRETPASLMLPLAPKAGKRIFLEHIAPLWSRFSFFWKVTCRNLFLYKRRFAMTVIGISGCTALLLTGFGLYDAIWDIIDNQYGPIVHYDTTVALDDDAITLDVDRVEQLLGEREGVSSVVRVQQNNYQAASPKDEDALMRVQIIIPSVTDELTQAVTLRERLDRTAIPFDDDAVVITEKLSQKLGVKAGDKISLFEQDVVGDAVGQAHELTVTGVCENYVGNLVYVGKDAWKTVDEVPPAYQTLFANVSREGSVRKDLASELTDVDHVSTVLFSDETIDLYRSMLTVVSLVVVVLIVSAAALAFIVLYNLTNINVSERVREIASLKVLGFTSQEVYVYIFREIILLSIIGDLVGLALGTWLAHFVVVTAEVDYVMFGRTIHLSSYLYSFALTLAFTVLVIVFMRKKLDRVDMVESLKSVD